MIHKLGINLKSRIRQEGCTRFNLLSFANKFLPSSIVQKAIHYIPSKSQTRFLVCLIAGTLQLCRSFLEFKSKDILYLPTWRIPAGRNATIPFSYPSVLPLFHNVLILLSPHLLNHASTSIQTHFQGKCRGEESYEKKKDHGFVQPRWLWSNAFSYKHLLSLSMDLSYPTCIMEDTAMNSVSCNLNKHS